MTMKTFQQFQEDSSLTGDSSGFQGRQLDALERNLDKVKNRIPGLKDKNIQTQIDREKEREERTQDRREKEAAVAAQKEADRAEDRRRKEELHQAKLDKMKQQNEVYDPEVQGRSQIRKTGEGGRVGRDRRKSEPERRRMKAVGGGKMAPVSYKDRKDIGSQKQTSDRVQQPTKERGSAEVKQSYADKVKAERRAAAKARAAAKKSGGEVKKSTTSSKDAEKQATKLLSTKKTEKKPVNPNYKPQKASGMTRAERMKVTRKGETMLRGIMKQQETDKYKKETGTNPDAKGRTKIMGRVHKRMST
jgi:hypothetical protein